MNIEIKDSFEPVSENSLSELESKLGIVIPLEYRGFILSHNGGRPNLRDFEVNIDGYLVKTAVRYFLGIVNANDFKTSDTFSLEFYIRTHLHTRRMPKNLLPIALDYVDNLICISAAGNEYGQIFFWDRDLKSEGEPDYNNIYFIAKSFTEFLNMLYQRIDL